MRSLSPGDVSNESTFRVDPLMDGVLPSNSPISKEALELSEFVKNPKKSLVDRVESYEDIISIEIGDTPLTRMRSVERDTGLRQLYIKFEGGNPSGTQKDRIAYAQCLDALRRKYDTITIASCGNFGAAMSQAAFLAGLRCVIFIPEGYHTDRISEMEAYGAEVFRFPGSYEDNVWHSQAEAKAKRWYDANPGGNNTSLQINAYAEIAYEIYDMLRDAPKMVAVPVSNGTTLAGIYRGFVTLHRRGRTSRVPMMIAGSSYRKNPIVESFRLNMESCKDLEVNRITESKVNEPLINWHSFDGDEALYAIRKSHGHAADVTDEQLIRYAKNLREKEGLQVLPASTAGLYALMQMHKANPLDSDRYVAVITGRK
ncbi:MAG TPA: pyridoxal-phosphate dependent enzyme [Saprospiraceae bacterium]|nr:pyridoxal-phosphate dependent enzyme [Saprospiraceae bacterium]